MKVFIILATLVACISSLSTNGDAVTVDLYEEAIHPMNRPESLRGRIFGGTLATANQFPWQVILSIKRTTGQYLCGGSLISTVYVLTAAHCVKDATEILALFGTNMRNTSTQTKYAIQYSYNSNFNTTTLNYDIATIRLASAVILNPSVTTIQLPTQSQVAVNFENATVQVSGYGQTGTTGATTNNLMFANLKVMSNANCAKIYGTGIVTNAVLCATPNGLSQGTCFGDSGGPLILNESGKWTQIGIVSFVNGRGCELPANGFTRTASYLSFVTRTTGIAVRT